MNNEVLADAIEIRKRRIVDCNSAARRLIAQVEGGLGHNVADIMALDDREIMKGSMDVIDAMSRLRAANQQYDTLRRRNA